MELKSKTLKILDKLRTEIKDKLEGIEKLEKFKCFKNLFI